MRVVGDLGRRGLQGDFFRSGFRASAQDKGHAGHCTSV